MSEINIPRFQLPDKEEKPIPEDKNCYCVHCFEDKPESAMSVIDDCCQACLDEALGLLKGKDMFLKTIRENCEEGIKAGEEGDRFTCRAYHVINLAYLKGR